MYKNVAGGSGHLVAMPERLRCGSCDRPCAGRQSGGNGGSQFCTLPGKIQKPFGAIPKAGAPRKHRSWLSSSLHLDKVLTYLSSNPESHTHHHLFLSSSALLSRLHTHSNFDLGFWVSVGCDRVLLLLLLLLLAGVSHGVVVEECCRSGLFGLCYDGGYGGAGHGGGSSGRGSGSTRGWSEGI